MSGINPLKDSHAIQPKTENKLSSIDSRTVKIAGWALFSVGVAAAGIAGIVFTAVTGGAGGLLLAILSVPFFCLGTSGFVKHTFEIPKM